MPLIIAVDFDGTIVEHDFPRIGAPAPGCFEWLRRLQEGGALLILYTMRSDGQPKGDVLTQAVDFCLANGVEFWAINHNPEQNAWTSSQKIYAHVYVDDAAVGCPLLPADHTRERPVVDWEAVGPQLMAMLEGRKQALGKHVHPQAKVP